MRKSQVICTVYMKVMQGLLTRFSQLFTARSCVTNLPKNRTTHRITTAGLRKAEQLMPSVGGSKGAGVTLTVESD